LKVLKKIVILRTVEILSYFFGDTMNVKITLSVPIEEIENEINNLLEDSKKRTILLTEKINDVLLESGNALAQLSMIEDLRKKLNVIDLKLEDSYSILSGYVRYKTNKGSQGKSNEHPSNQEGESDQDPTE